MHERTQTSTPVETLCLSLFFCVARQWACYALFAGSAHHPPPHTPVTPTQGTRRAPVLLSSPSLTGRDRAPSPNPTPPFLPVFGPLQHLERTVQNASKQRQALVAQFGTSGPTPEDGSVDDGMDDGEASAAGAGGGYNRAVLRASLVRCASVLMETPPFRRATLAVSDPAAQKAARDAALSENGGSGGGGGAAPVTEQQEHLQQPLVADLGPDPLAAIVRSRRSSDGSNSGTRRAMDAWEAIPPQVTDSRERDRDRLGGGNREIDKHQEK